MNVLARSDAKQVTAAFTRPDNTTAYNANDVVGTDPGANLQFNNVLDGYGSEFLILGARLRIDVNAVPSEMSSFRLHLYSAAPTAIADNAAYNLPAGDRDKYLGYITLSVPVDLGDTLWAQDDNVNFSGRFATGSNTLYGILQTTAAYTPSAECVKTITLNVVGV